jgi:hypothetical protein
VATKPFKKGHKKLGGRVKGTPNKNTKALKDAILEAAALAGDALPGKETGLTKYLKSQAISNPGPFLSLLGKVLPMQLQGDPDHPLTVIERIIVNATDKNCKGL